MEIEPATSVFEMLALLSPFGLLLSPIAGILLPFFVLARLVY